MGWPGEIESLKEATLAQIPKSFDERLKLFQRKHSAPGSPPLQKRLLKLARQCECAFDLCEKANGILNKPIRILAHPRFPDDVKGSVFELKPFYLIFLKPTLTPLSIQLTVLHELSHIFLGHLLPATIDELFSTLSLRTYFTDSQEKAAQKFACKLLSVLIDVHSLVPPNPPVAARFEALIG